MLFISAQVRRLVVIHIYQGKNGSVGGGKKAKKKYPTRGSAAGSSSMNQIFTLIKICCGIENNNFLCTPTLWALRFKNLKTHFNFVTAVQPVTSFC